MVAYHHWLKTSIEKTGKLTMPTEEEQKEIIVNRKSKVSKVEEALKKLPPAKPETPKKKLVKPLIKKLDSQLTN